MINFSKILDGNSEEESIRLLKIHGKNVITEKKRTPAILILFRQFKDLLVIILMISTLLAMFLGDIVESVAIIIVVIMNGLFGFFQEYKTEKTLEALKKLSSPESNVIRGGVLKKIKDSDQYEEMKKKMEEVNTVAQRIGASMYQQNPNPSTGEAQTGTKETEGADSGEKKDGEPVEGEVVK